MEGEGLIQKVLIFEKKVQSTLISSSRKNNIIAVKLHVPVLAVLTKSAVTKGKRQPQEVNFFFQIQVILVVFMLLKSGIGSSTIIEIRRSTATTRSKR